MEKSVLGKHLFLWRIQNYSSSFKDPSVFLYSPWVRAMGLYETYWRLQWEPVSKHNGDYIGLYLERSKSDHGPENLVLNLEVCLIDFSGAEVFNKKFTNLDVLNGKKVGNTRFLLRDEIFKQKNRYIPNDTLTVQLRVANIGISRRMASESVVRTRIRVERSTFLWTIQGVTPMVSDHTERVVHVECRVLPKGFELSCKFSNSFEGREALEGRRVLHLAIQRRGTHDARTFMRATIQALGGDRAEMEAEHMFEDGDSHTWHLPSFAISDGHLEEDRLDLACEFAISDGTKDSQMEETSILPAKVYPREDLLPGQIRSLCCQSETLPDIIVVPSDGQRNFRGHKLIMSARSLGLREILKEYESRKHSSGNLPNSSDIPGAHVGAQDPDKRFTVYNLGNVDHLKIWCFDTEIVSQAFGCMYNDVLMPSNASNAQKLYEAGFQLGFKLLREKSLKYLRSHIGTNDVFSILVFADFYGIYQLQRDCMKVIMENRRCLLAAKAWLKFRKDYETLSVQILNNIRREFC